MTAKKTVLIGISGKKRSGKNTSATAIVRHAKRLGLRVGEYSFGDYVKKATERAFSFLGLDFWTEDVSKKEKIRPLLQGVGTHAGRRFNKNIWVNVLADRIASDRPDIAVIPDVRFPNEVDFVLGADGYIIRLLRSPHPEDADESETALDTWEASLRWPAASEKDFDHTFVIDNRKMSIPEQQAETIRIFETVCCRRSLIPPWRGRDMEVEKMTKRKKGGEVNKEQCRLLADRIAELENQYAEPGDGCKCQECGNIYREDVIVPDDLWDEIRPQNKGPGAGLLCGQCIAKKISAAFAELQKELAILKASEEWCIKKLDALSVDFPAERYLEATEIRDELRTHEQGRRIVGEGAKEGE